MISEIIQKTMLLVTHTSSMKATCKINLTKCITAFSCLLFSTGFFHHANAEEITFVVQPVMQPQKTQASYQPLVDYLRKETGLKIKLVTEKNFLTYWLKMKKGKYDLILDAAHFTDYRAKKLSYSVLAKIPDTVTFSLITHKDNLVLEANELVAKRLTTLPPPSMGASSLLRLFNNPTRQPIISSAKSAQHAIESVQTGKSFAAFVPTPMLQNQTDINVITTTKPLPHMGFSASSKLNSQQQALIKKALLAAKQTPGGKKVLQHLKIAEFSDSNNEAYHGYEAYLDGMTRSRTRLSRR